MSKFKKGDRVKVISGHHIGVVGTIAEDSIAPHITADEGYTFCKHENALQLIQENTMKYEQGDVLIEGGCEHKILAVCGELYFLSCPNNFKQSRVSYTQEELDYRGFKLKTPESDTIEVNGKKYNKDAVIERLKELEEVA